ncbi:hypothetical protein D9M68_763950 [compost metagenome]
MDPGLVGVVGSEIQGADDCAQHLAISAVDVQHIQAGGVLLEGGDSRKAGAGRPGQQHAIDRVMADDQGVLPGGFVEEVEQHPQHPFLERSPGFAAEEGGTGPGGEPIGAGDLIPLRRGGDLTQAAGTDLAQLGHGVDRDLAASQHQVQGLPRPGIVGTEHPVEGQVLDHLAEGPGLLGAATGQRNGTRIQRPPFPLEIIDMAMTHQVAAPPANRHFRFSAHRPAPWGC